MLHTKDNKEHFRLLDLSSDEESEDLHLEIIPSRKKKISRKERNRAVSAPKPPEPNIGSEVRCALQWALRGTLVLWLLMLTWLCAMLYDQVTDMQSKVHQVITSSNSVGDTLQNCHSMTRILQANASDLSIRLTKLELKHKELAEQVEKATSDLGQVTEKLSAEPLLADMPRRLSELQRTVGLIGSRVNGFDEAVKSVRTLASTAGSGVEEVKTLLQSLEAKSNETIANVSASSRKEDELKELVVALNSTLTEKVEALHTRVEEISKPASTAAPSSTAAATTSGSTASTTAPTTTTTLPPGPPAKPFVLQ